jgi:hypothetical protein
LLFFSGLGDQQVGRIEGDLNRGVWYQSLGER